MSLCVFLSLCLRAMCMHACICAEASLRAAKVLETKAFIAQFLEQQEAAKRAREARDRAEEQKRQDHWTMVRAFVFLNQDVYVRA